VTTVFVDGQELFRVRIGPMASVESADEALRQVIEAGVTNARIVVD
jgi:rare lipoprotein A